jgi:small subunit ribosomal protein S4
LGSGVFEKTSGQKFALAQSRKKGFERRSQKSDYGKELLEKQKARFTYGLTERQFSKYAIAAGAKRGADQQNLLYQTLEWRLDNAILRAGFASTRGAARQMVSHGHFTVNGKRVNIPSYQLKVGDKIELRKGSAGKAIFTVPDERLKDYLPPSWLTVDREKKLVTVAGAPKLKADELTFDIGQVLEFYSR